MTNTVETRMLATNVPSDLADAFRRIADQHERSVSAELRRLVREHVEIHAEPERDA